MRLSLLLVVLVVLVVLTGGVLLLRAQAEESPTPAAAAPKITVGVFDSRAVVVAYANSEQFGKIMKDLKARHETAKAAGDEELMAKLEAEAQSTQKEFHRQCFAATPVDNLLELIKDEIPAIAKQAGVDLIVSKWQIAYQAEDAKIVDVTMALIAPFKPGEKALKTIGEMADQQPVPVEELEGHEDH